MATERQQKWGVIGIIGGLIAVCLTVVGLAWGGGRVVTSVEKDVKSVAENQKEDRATIEKLAGIVTKLGEAQSDNYKELKQDANDSKLRDERQSTQYAAILSHMSQQTASDERTEIAIGGLQVDMGKIQTKVGTLINDNDKDE